MKLWDYYSDWWEVCAERHPSVQSCPDRWSNGRLSVSLLRWEPRFDSRHHRRYFSFSFFLYYAIICKCTFSWSNETCLTSDISRMNSLAVAANSTGIIILGGGVAKHHICNANVWVSIYEQFWSLQRPRLNNTPKVWKSNSHNVTELY